MKVIVITPTCNRPVAFALCERWMARQTRQPDEWIVADGGTEPQSLTLGQTYLHAPSAPGYANFIGNLQRAVDAADKSAADVIVVAENDDWYHASHIEVILGQFTPGVIACGDDAQRYYNIEHRIWHLFPNRGASLCQTAFRREAIPAFRRALLEAGKARSYGVDGRFWASLPDHQKSLVRTETVLGIKGLPGQVGLGVGHRPQVSQWNRDPHLKQLTAWIGPQDAEVYGELWATT